MELYLYLFLSYILTGLLMSLFICFYDMRGKEIDLDYFNREEKLAFVIIIGLGYFSLFIVLAVYCNDNKIFTKLLYRIANIGIKKGKTDDDRAEN